MRTYLVVCFIFLLNVSTSKGQNGWNWLPSDPYKSKVMYANFADNYQMKNYVEAQKYLDWLLDSVPNLNQIIYINGLKVYEQLEKSEKDSITKRHFQDEIFELLRLRYEFFPPSGIHAPAPKFWEKEFDYTTRFKREDMYQVYKRIVHEHKLELSQIHLFHFFVSFLKLYQLEDLGEQVLIDDIKLVTDIIQENIDSAKGSEKEKWIDFMEKFNKVIDETHKMIEDKK